LGLRKFQADGFLLTRVYTNILVPSLHDFKHSTAVKWGSSIRSRWRTAIYTSSCGGIGDLKLRSVTFPKSVPPFVKHSFPSLIGWADLYDHHQGCPIIFELHQFRTSCTCISPSQNAFIYSCEFRFGNMFRSQKSNHTTNVFAKLFPKPLPMHTTLSP